METNIKSDLPTRKLKFAVIIFHKNVRNYRPEWIKKCVESIQNQTYKEFDVFELDYGGGATQIYPDSNFASLELETHADAHNFILDKVFALGYDYAFNVNVDDYYAFTRFEKQIVYAIQGYDVISSNFYNIDENDALLATKTMHDLDIISEANKNHNILAHPVICYSRNFWTTCTRLWSGQIPLDDFNLWKRSFGKYKFVIVPEFLLFYRVHPAKVSKAKEEPTYVERNPAALTDPKDIRKHPNYDPKADRIMKSSWDSVPNKNGDLPNEQMTEEKRLAKQKADEEHDAKRLEWLKHNR